MDVLGSSTKQELEANIIANKLEGKVESIAQEPLDVQGLGRFHRICAFLTWQPIENLKPLMDVLLPGGTLHYYNHESEEDTVLRRAIAP